MEKEGCQPEPVFLFGSFSEDEASYFQSLSLRSSAALPSQPDSFLLDNAHPADRASPPGFSVQDLGVTSSSGDKAGNGPYDRQSTDCIPDKVITEVRPSDGREPAQQVNEWGHGDRRHPQPDSFTSTWSPTYPPVVDKLPLPLPNQSVPCESTVQRDEQVPTGPLTTPSAESTVQRDEQVPAGPLTTPSAAAASPASPLVQPPVQGVASEPVVQAQTETPAPAPPPVRKPPSSWAALLANSSPTPAPAIVPRLPQGGAPSATAPALHPVQPNSSTPSIPAPAPAAVASGTQAPDDQAVRRGAAGDSAGPAAASITAGALTPGAPLTVASASVAPSIPNSAPAEAGTSTRLPRTTGTSGPRGFVNRGNLCFANATLQALIGSNSFAKLLEDLRQHPERRRDPCPTVGAVLKFWEALCKTIPGHSGPQAQTPQGPQPVSSQQQQDNAVTAGEGSKAAGQAGAGKSTQGGGGVSYAALAKTGRGTSHLAPSMDAASVFEDVLSRFSPQHHKNGVQIRQEDAQEFLSYLLDKMHDELCSSYRSTSTASIGSEPALTNGGQFGEVGGALAEQHHPDAEDEDNEDEGGWETVGVRNRTAVTRQHALVQSDVSNLFFGQLRSEIKTRGVKASATVQPFSVLQLDIAREPVRNVEDALLVLGQAELVEGYRPEDKPGSHATTASKLVKFQSLPNVLVLHLMRFTYNARGSVKLHKPVGFPFHLEISRDLVYAPAAASSPLASKEGRTYRLFATVVHHGKEPSRGHYTADVRQPDDSWLRFDDATVHPVPAQRVAREQAYLLLYERV